MKIYNFYRKNTGNVGDQYSTPLKYFSFSGYQVIELDLHTEVTQEVLTDLKDNIVIFGGGGLIANDYFEKNIIKIINSKPKKVIFWGAGHNTHNESEVIAFPEYFSNADLVGIRDYGFKYEWVPCSSCMNELFDKSYEVTRDIVVYEHKHHPLEIQGYEKMNNYEQLEKVFDFLGSANTIITNSYHGAYWGQLLGKKILVVGDFSTKFHYFRDKVKVVKNFKIEELDHLVPNHNLLKDYKEKNVEFFNLVSRLLK